MVKLYVEGGGDAQVLNTACREGFAEFIKKAGIKNRPCVVACGSRSDAYESYCTAVAQGAEAMLLVDSEAEVSAAHQDGGMGQWLPWTHLHQRDNDKWSKPKAGSEADCHLMVQVKAGCWRIGRRSRIFSILALMPVRCPLRPVPLKAFPKRMRMTHYRRRPGTVKQKLPIARANTHSNC